MHLSDGILSPGVLVVGAVVAVAGVTAGLCSLDLERIPRAAVMTSVFFIASFLHVPVGPGQLHLILNGLAAMVLGVAVFPAILIALFLQALLLGYGGVTALGVNVAIMALPAWLAALPARRFLSRPRGHGAVAWTGGAVAVLALLGGLVLSTLALLVSDADYQGLLPALIGLHAPLMVIEAIATGGAVLFLVRVKPELFRDTTPERRS